VSYFEWVQNFENEQWDEDKVNGKLKIKMQRATEDVIDKQTELNDSLDALEKQRKKKDPSGESLQPVNLRTAAYVLAIERVAKVTLERGIWP